MQHVNADTVHDSNHSDEPSCRYDDPEARLKERLERLDRSMAKLYLGPRSTADKYYAKELTHQPGFESANREGSKRLRRIVDDFLHRLDAQQDNLRSRRPPYALRARMQAIKTPRARSAEHQELLLRRCLAKEAAFNLLRKIHRLRLAKNYELFFK